MHTVRQSKGLKKLVFADSLSDVPPFIEGVKRLREALPQDIQDKMKRQEDTGRTESEECKKCVDFYFARNVVRLDPMPDEFAARAAE